MMQSLGLRDRARYDGATNRSAERASFTAPAFSVLLARLHGDPETAQISEGRSVAMCSR